MKRAQWRIRSNDLKLQAAQKQEMLDKKYFGQAGNGIGGITQNIQKD